MTPGDLDEVMELEMQAFTCPWTPDMYLRELEKDEGIYLTARQDGELVGYGGVLIILDEAHVMTLAVREDRRRRGVAVNLMLEMMREAQARRVRFLTLEVRKSNQAAIGLYSRLGFQIMGERKDYYMDNFENALIMWTEDITAPDYRRIVGDVEKRYRRGGR